MAETIVGGLVYELFKEDKKAVVKKIAPEFKNKTSFTIEEEISFYKVKYVVTEIAEKAFYECRTLASITIPNSVTKVGKDAFYGCSSLTQPVYNEHMFVRLPASYSGAYTIPDGIKVIANYAFGYCQYLTSISIPNGVTKVDERAFEGCVSLTSVIIPDGVTMIGNSMFRYCKGLIDITIPNSVISIGEVAFGDCISLTSIIIPNSVLYVEAGAFAGCQSLSTIALPNSVRSIGHQAFVACKSLTSITIPDSVMSINKETFLYCSALTSITIGKMVRYIEEDAFGGCSSLSSIIVEKGNSKYDSRNNCNAIIETATNQLILGCKSTTIPNNIISIGERAFYPCSSPTSITIPSSVTRIGRRAFSGCKKLESIVVEPANENYDSRDNCNAIIETATNTMLKGCQNTVIPKSVTSIDDRAFSSCSGLTTITIPNSVRKVGKETFYNCSSLTSVSIGNGVTSIGEGAFESCKALSSITIQNTQENIILEKSIEYSWRNDWISKVQFVGKTENAKQFKETAAATKKTRSNLDKVKTAPLSSKKQQEKTSIFKRIKNIFQK